MNRALDCWSGGAEIGFGMATDFELALVVLSSHYLPRIVDLFQLRL